MEVVLSVFITLIKLHKLRTFQYLFLLLVTYQGLISYSLRFHESVGGNSNKTGLGPIAIEKTMGTM